MKRKVKKLNYSRAIKTTVCSGEFRVVDTGDQSIPLKRAEKICVLFSSTIFFLLQAFLNSNVMVDTNLSHKILTALVNIYDIPIADFDQMRR